MANTITQIKRLIGLRFEDAAVKAELETHANFNAVAMPDGDVGFEVRLRACARARRLPARRSRC
jgi:molecular chaperone DnaK (HSP70)